MVQVVLSDETKGLSMKSLGMMYRKLLTLNMAPRAIAGFGSGTISCS